jgi:hypothetical protein
MPFPAKRFVLADFHEDPNLLQCFGQLDDNDIWGAIKFWRNHEDSYPFYPCWRTMVIERKCIPDKAIRAEPIKKESGGRRYNLV